MARIRTSQHKRDLAVVVSGRLTSADMRRLEHACAPALTAHAVRLRIDVRRVTHTDPAASAVLKRLSDLGATIL